VKFNIAIIHVNRMARVGDNVEKCVGGVVSELEGGVGDVNP